MAGRLYARVGIPSRSSDVKDRIRVVILLGLRAEHRLRDSRRCRRSMLSNIIVDFVAVADLLSLPRSFLDRIYHLSYVSGLFNFTRIMKSPKLEADCTTRTVGPRVQQFIRSKSYGEPVVCYAIESLWTS